MKKTLLVTLIVSLLMGLCSCGSQTTKKADFTIGICNYVKDASLQQIEDNIVARIQEIAKEKNLTIEVKVQNGNGDAIVLDQIISNFITDKVDLMIGIATPVAIMMQNKTEKNQIPVIFSAVSDPLGAGLVDSLEKPGKNITGTSDYLNTDALVNIILANHPDMTKVGLLYDKGQDASTAPIERAKELFAANGVTCIESTGTQVTEIQQAAANLIAQGVSAIFTPTDNTVMTAELSIYEDFQKAGIPHYAGANSFALNGAFLGYGVDYANLGVETANMVKEVLIDKKSPADVAVKTFDNGTATINTDISDALGYSENGDITKLSEIIGPYCTKIETLKTQESFD